MHTLEDEESWPVTTIVLNVLGVLMIVVSVVVLVLVWRLRRTYVQRIFDLETRVAGRKAGAMPLTKMVRVKAGLTPHRLAPHAALADKGSMLMKLASVFDLREEFRFRAGGGGVAPEGKPPVGLSSMSEYLSSLRPEAAAAKENAGMVNEVDALLTHAILKALGPNIAAAVLPLIGETAVAAALVKVGVGSGIIVQPDTQSLGTVIYQLLSRGIETIADANITVIGAFMDLVATLRGEKSSVLAPPVAAEHGGGGDAGGDADKTTPLLGAEEIEMSASIWTPPAVPEGPSALSKMRWGEAKNGPFVTFPEEAFPSPFVVETQYEKAMMSLSNIEKANVENTGAKYDLDTYPVDVPVPIDPVTLPGLHKGFGGTVKTQTFREILCARVLIMLLNRLASNDTRGQGEAKFVVSIAGKEVTRPDDFVQGLMDTGHTVSMRGRYNVGSFGYGLCIKEEDGTWTNLPWALILRSTHDDQYGRPAQCAFVHGGLNIFVEGPIVKKAMAQHHNAMEGFTGWYTNETCNVPWLTEKILSPDTMTGPTAVRCARMCGLLATVLNCFGTRLKLPMGGYLLTGVCLDSCAAIEKALFGTMNAYPYLNVNRFYMAAIREAYSFCDMLVASGDDRADDMKSLLHGMESLPCDNSPTPSMAADAARRILATTPPNMPFKIMERSVDACKSIISEHQNRPMRPDGTLK